MPQNSKKWLLEILSPGGKILNKIIYPNFKLKWVIWRTENRIKSKISFFWCNVISFYSYSKSSLNSELLPLKTCEFVYPPMIWQLTEIFNRPCCHFQFRPWIFWSRSKMKNRAMLWILTLLQYSPEILSNENLHYTRGLYDIY